MKYVVVVPDGQPVVIGGMMKNQKLQSDSKIPILGDIPILGMAFKRKITDNVKTELLIFLTPHIVRDPIQLAEMTQKERGAQEMVPKSFSEQELDKFIDGLPVKDPSKIGMPPPEPSKPKPGLKRR